MFLKLLHQVLKTRPQGHPLLFPKGHPWPWLFLRVLKVGEALSLNGTPLQEETESEHVITGLICVPFPSRRWGWLGLILVASCKKQSDWNLIHTACVANAKIFTQVNKNLSASFYSKKKKVHTFNGFVNSCKPMLKRAIRWMEKSDEKKAAGNQSCCYEKVKACSKYKIVLCKKSMIYCYLKSHKNEQQILVWTFWLLVMIML